MRLRLVRGIDGTPAADFGPGHTGPNAIPRSTIRELARGDEPHGHRQLLPQWITWIPPSISESHGSVRSTEVMK